jgi:hypothetical protein
MTVILTMVPNGLRETCQDLQGIRDLLLGGCRVLNTNLGSPLKYLRKLVSEEGRTREMSAIG